MVIRDSLFLTNNVPCMFRTATISRAFAAIAEVHTSADPLNYWPSLQRKLHLPLEVPFHTAVPEKVLRAV